MVGWKSKDDQVVRSEQEVVINWPGKETFLLLWHRHHYHHPHPHRHHRYHHHCHYHLLCCQVCLDILIGLMWQNVTLEHFRIVSNIYRRAFLMKYISPSLSSRSLVFDEFPHFAQFSDVSSAFGRWGTSFSTQPLQTKCLREEEEEKLFSIQILEEFPLSTSS